MNLAIGHATAWLTVAMVVVEASLVIGRYVFGIGSIAVQETVVYMHGFLFTLAAGYALAGDGHVRVDIVYRKLGRRGRAGVNFFGAIILLLPFMAAILWSSWPYVTESWRTLEGSRETSGLPILFLLKSAIPAMAVLLALQGLSLAVHSFLSLTGRSVSTDDTIP